MSSLFDDKIINEDAELDSVSDSVLKGLGMCCDLLSGYKAEGVIKKGEYIITPSVKEDEHKIDNHKIRLSEPGFVTVMREMFGEKSQCHSSVDFIEMGKPGFLYELNTYADEEMSIANKLFQCKVKDEWLVGKATKESLEDYRLFAEKIKKNDNVKFAVFAYCGYLEPEQPEIKEENACILFRGIYQLDEVASMYHRRIVLHLCSEEFRFDM